VEHSAPELAVPVWRSDQALAVEVPQGSGRRRSGGRRRRNT